MRACLNVWWHFSDRVLGELVSLARSPMLFLLLCFYVYVSPCPSVHCPLAQVSAGGGSAAVGSGVLGRGCRPSALRFLSFCPSAPENLGGLCVVLVLEMWLLQALVSIYCNMGGPSCRGPSAVCRR